MNPLNQKTDCELVSEFQKFDNLQALETLVYRHKEAIYTSIYYLVNKDPYLSEDIFQDVFIKIIDTLRNGKYNEEGKFLPWAIRIAHNFCIDHIRKMKRMPFIRTGDNTTIFETVGENDNRADLKIMKRQTHAKIRQMIELLPYEQKEILILRHYANLSFKEIAYMKKCSINTALGRMRYALMNLRKMMAEKEIIL